MVESMNVETFESAALSGWSRGPYEDFAKGGQELIAGEIAACFPLGQCTWLPFPGPTETLENLLRLTCRHRLLVGEYMLTEPIDGMYLGTPTVVGGRALFPSEDVTAPTWTVAYERLTVRRLVDVAVHWGAHTIVTGLGSGDISVEQRIEDMGGGRVVCMKEFDGFTDWVIKREISR